MTRWETPDSAQSTYEELRSAALAGQIPLGPAARRFARAGFAGLLALPARAAHASEFAVNFVGNPRPPWCGMADPRTEALCASFGLILVAADSSAVIISEVGA